MQYDGLGRRTVKAVSNSADWDCTYRYYYDDQRLIEERNGSGVVLRQYYWGPQYVDELMLVGINQAPLSYNQCERFFWALHDANYNVTGLVDARGNLVERYEYTPYGQRTIYSRGWLLADVTDDGCVTETD